MATEMLIKLHQRMAERRLALRECQPCKPRVRLVQAAAAAPVALVLREQKNDRVFDAGDGRATGRAAPRLFGGFAIQDVRRAPRDAPAEPATVAALIDRAPCSAAQGESGAGSQRRMPLDVLLSSLRFGSDPSAVQQLGARVWSRLQTDPFVQRLERLQ